MAKIQLAGHVQHFPGIWGAGTPVFNATVEVIDIDPVGTDDIIWSGKTNKDGNFSGLSTEWQDTTSVPVWIQDSLIPPAGHWGTKKIPDPTDLLLLKLRVKHAGKIHEVFPFLNNAPIPVIVPWAPIPVGTKKSRALLVVNNTVSLGRADYKALYQFLENSGDFVARTTLGPCYQSIQSLNGAAATFDAFCAALKTAANIPGITTIDVILNMHGGKETLFFADGGATGVPTSSIQTKLTALGLQTKLRLVYNTCCYGSTHAPALRAGGFNSVIGSTGVNANSATEYPLFLGLWANGLPIDQAISVAQAEALRLPADAVAQQLGFSDVNSFKTISGTTGLTVESGG